MYTVLFTKSADREYRALPVAVRKKVDEVLEILRVNPVSEILRIRKLRGRQAHYRVRLGDYRILYGVEADRLIVTVIRVGHRRDVYRHY